MRPRYYIDHNILAEADDENFGGFQSDIKNHDVDLVISPVHLTEINRGPNFERYVSRIARLRPGLLQGVGAGTDPKKRDLNFDYDPRQIIDQDRESSSASLGILYGLVPLLKFVGGLDQISIDDLVEMQLRKLRAEISGLRQGLSGAELANFESVINSIVVRAEAEISGALRKGAVAQLALEA